MILLPTENFTINTSLTKDEVITKLNEVVEPYKAGYLPYHDGGDKPYEGEVTNDTFKINRIIKYRNSFIPKISGQVFSEEKGTGIKIKMRLNMAVIVFSIFLALFDIAFIIILTVAGVYSEIDESTIFFLLFPGLFLVFGYAMLMGCFKYESIKSKKFFKELFN